MKINRQIDKELKAFSEMLPITYTMLPLIREVTGQQLIDKGMTHINEHQIEPKKRYMSKVSDRVSTNHYKTLKKIYKAKRTEGCKKYVQEILDLRIEQGQPKTIGGLTIKSE